MIEQLVHSSLAPRGFDLHYRWNTLQPEWSPQGWPLALPDIQWQSNTRLVLHFQDRITPTAWGCRELDAIELKYAQHAGQVIVIFYSHGLDQIYHGAIQLVDFSTHNWLTITDLIRVKSQWQSAFNQPKTQNWQCLNGRTCEHRRRAAALLQSWPRGQLSYGTEIPLTVWNYSTYRGTENWENFLRLLPIYSSCAVNIVTETNYDARPGVICEKTLYAFVAHQIPIVIGHPGAVQDCRDLGFDMFDDIVNTGYDWLPNDQRVERAIIDNESVIQGAIDLSKLQTRLQHNHDHAMNSLLTLMQHKAQQHLAKII